MTDFLLAEKLRKLSNELIYKGKIPGKCAGAYGDFRLYMSLKDYTSAEFLKSYEEVITVFVRFSKFLSVEGEADTGKAMRNFCVKFFWNNQECCFMNCSFPVFFINEGSKITDLYKAYANDKRTNLYNNNSFFDFVSSNPEAYNALFFLYSQRGMIKSYRTCEYFSVYTQEWTNTKNEKFYIRSKWEPMLGKKYISNHESEFLAGFEKDVAIRDLYEAIARGEYPSYELSLQIIPAERMKELNINIFDNCLYWPEEIVPYMKVGKLTLKNLPNDYEEEVKKSVFSRNILVPGISLCNDELSQPISFIQNSIRE